MSSTPHHAARARFDRILALIQSGALAEAAEQLATARRLAPRDVNLLNLAAHVATLQGDQQRAAALYQQVLKLQPDLPSVRFNLLRAQAIIAEQAGDLPAALTALRQAEKIVPHDAQVAAQSALIARQLCHFEPTPALGNAPLNPAAAMVLLDDPQAQYANAWRWAQQQFGGIKPLPPAPPRPDNAPLRLGFLTSDLHEHATAYLIAEIFELLDRRRFAPFLYDYGAPDASAISRRIRGACPDGGNVYGQDAPSIAARIRSDAIDLLIDLKGYTRGGRLDILANRPAPLQLHWLGFPGTLGCQFIDYFIADAVALPPALQTAFSEKILTLPDSYQCNDRQRPLPPPLPRSAFDLPDDALVFASFNQTYKLHPDLLTLWAQILRDVPNGLLWLLASNKVAPEAVRAFFAAQGIAPERLHFAAPIPLAQHLQRYHVVDIALDTFPIGGHTTTSDALWLGVPVVTLAGSSFVSRVAASLLTATGQQALIAENPTDYRNLAVTLAQDTTRRQAIRATLVNDRLRLPLFASEIFTHHLMTGLELAWKRHRDGLAPASLTVAP